MLPFLIGHNDTLLSLYMPGREGERSFFVRSEQGDIDLPRAREAGLAGGFFAVFVPAEPQEPAPIALAPKPARPTPPKTGQLREQPSIEQPYALRVTMAMVAGLYRLETESAGQVKVVRTLPELVHCLQNDVHAAILHFEGAEAIDPDLNALEVFYQAGLRSLGLVWSRSNCLRAWRAVRFSPFSRYRAGSDGGRTRTGTGLQSTWHSCLTSRTSTSKAFGMW